MHVKLNKPDYRGMSLLSFRSSSVLRMTAGNGCFRRDGLKVFVAPDAVISNTRRWNIGICFYEGLAAIRLL